MEMPRLQPSKPRLSLAGSEKNQIGRSSAMSSPKAGPFSQSRASKSKKRETTGRKDVAPMLPRQTDDKFGMKTLVLDLDETLVHSTFKKQKHSDIKQAIEIDGILQTIYVNIRPWAEEFIREMARHFEIVMFTASIRKYA